MRRKRFKHHLDTIVDILHGYRIQLDYNNFAHKGSGTYNLDLLTGSLFFNGEQIKEYPIFNFISYWFDQDLTKHNIPRQLIKTANVMVIVVSKLLQTRHKNNYFLWGENLISTKNHDLFTIEIFVYIITDETEYKKQSKGVIFN